MPPYSTVYDTIVHAWEDVKEANKALGTSGQGGIPTLAIGNQSSTGVRQQRS